MLDAKTHASARIGAAVAILDRACGKAKQEVEVVGPDLSRLTDDELDELQRLTSLMYDDEEAEATTH